MPDTIQPNRPTRSPRARRLASRALISGILLAGCGGSSSPGVANIKSSSTPSTNTSHSTSSGGSGRPPSRAQLLDHELKYAECMRANGFPNFPDPSPNGSFNGPQIPAGATVPAKCSKLPSAGLSLGTTTHPSAQTVAHWVKVAHCMRRHGIDQFPDPTTSIPSNPPPGQLEDSNGVILVFPPTIDEQSPLFTRAAADCEFPLTNQ